MKKILYILLLLAVPALAQDVRFEEGNQAYDQGNYELAVEHYTAILAEGQTSAGLHYNLGNAYYRLNDVANSIYHYEKALQLDPGDPDVLNNLQFAQNMRIDEIEEAAPSRLEQRWNALLDLFTTSGWAIFSIVAMFGFACLFLLYYFNPISWKKRVFFASSMVSLLFALGTLGLGFGKKSVLENQAFSIVFADQIDIRSEPNTRSSQVFTLHAGTKVEVLEQHQGWSKIEIGSGAQGWVQHDYLKDL